MNAAQVDVRKVDITTLKSLDRAALKDIATKLQINIDGVSERSELRQLIREKVKLLESNPIAGNGEKEGTFFDTSKREPTAHIEDAKTGKIVKQPVGCFGWYYRKDNDYCTKQCPHAEKCAVLSVGAEKAIKALSVEVEVEKEAAKVTKEDVADVTKASKKSEKDKKPSEMTKSKKSIDRKTLIKIAYDRSWARQVEDKDYRSIYMRALKKFGEKPFRVEKFLMLVADLGFDVSDPEEFIKDTLRPMINDEDFVLA